MLPVNPAEIEQRSFQIIDAEMGPHPFTPEQWPVVRRMIHATADFEFGRSVGFGGDAIRAGVEAIREGRPVLVDVKMLEAGINATLLQRFGVSLTCPISDPEVIDEARRLGLTRAIIAMRRARSVIEGGIVAIGNAPTALLELARLVREEAVRPALVIGVPVGFVSAAEAKLELESLPVPFITNRGRKGGTPAAVAAMNALLALAAS